MKLSEIVTGIKENCLSVKEWSEKNDPNDPRLMRAVALLQVLTLIAVEADVELDLYKSERNIA